MKYIQIKTKDEFKELIKSTKWKGSSFLWDHFRENTCYIPSEDCFISLEKALKLTNK